MNFYDLAGLRNSDDGSARQGFDAMSTPHRTTRVVFSALTACWAAFLPFLTASLAQAASVTWDGSDSSAWSLGTNWASGGAPVSGDSLVFTAGPPLNQPSNNDIAGLSLSGLLFNATSSFTSPLTLGGEAFTLTAPAVPSNPSLSNLNTTAGRNVTIGNGMVVSGSQAWNLAASANAITILSGNLSGTGDVTVSGGPSSNTTTLPALRLVGANNGGYSGTVSFADANANGGLILGSAGSMTGGLINLSSGGRNLWLTGGTGSGVYTFGLAGTQTTGGRVHFRGSTTSGGLYLTGGDVAWNPGGATDYVWSGTGASSTGFSHIDFNGSNDVTPRMLTLGNSVGTFFVSGTNKFFRNGGGGNNPGRVTLLSALADGNEATQRTLTSDLPLLILTRASVTQNAATPLRLTLSGGATAITNTDQLPAGNVTLSGGVLIFDTLSWPQFAGARPLGTGNGQLNFTGGGFAARGAGITIPNDTSGGLSDATFNRNFTLGTSVLDGDGSFYANAGVTIARDTTLTALRTITLAATGVGMSPGNPILQRITGSLAGAGSVVIVGASTNTSRPGELVLANTNSWNGAPTFSLTTGVFMNVGAGGLIVNNAIVRFEDDASLPTGATGTAYLAAQQRNSGTPFGFLLTGDATGKIYDVAAGYRFLIGSAASNSAAAGVFGVDGGKATVRSTSLLANYETDSAMTVNLLTRPGSELTLGEAGKAFTIMPTFGKDVVASSTATTYADSVSGTRLLLKRGAGTLALSNVSYTKIDGTTNQASLFEWQVGEGAVRGLSFDDPAATNANSLRNFLLALRGGVYEIDNSTGSGSTFSASLGISGTGKVSLGSGGGGFSAYGQNVAVTLTSSTGGTLLTWGSTGSGFVQTGDPLIFGSETANATLTFTNDIFLNGGSREIRVVDNPGSAADQAVLSGVISTPFHGINKTGDGVLVLTASNTYASAGGSTVISAGVLQVGAGGTTGWVSSRGMITHGVLAFNRSDDITYGTSISGSGSVTKLGTGWLRLTGTNDYLGGTAVMAGMLLVPNRSALPTSGTVTVGAGATLTLAMSASDPLLFNSSAIGDLFAGTMTNVVSDPTSIVGIDTSAGDVDSNGNLSSGRGLTKLGVHSLTLSGTNTFGGVTTILGGILILDGSAALPGGTGASGGTNNLVFGGGILGLGGGDFRRNLGTGTSSAVFRGSGGWAAYGADRVVDLGGATAAITWAAETTGLNGQVLLLGATSATHAVDVRNPFELGNATRTVQVERGLGPIDGRLSGSLAGDGAGLTKAGNGTLALAGANTYTGTTTIAGGVLILESETALPGGVGTLGGTSRLRFEGGVVGLGAGDFTRSLGTASADAVFVGAGGWAAYGDDRAVNLGGGSGTIEWSAATTGFNGQTLILGASSASHAVELLNPLNLGSTQRIVRVEDGSGSIDGRLAGTLSGVAGSGLTKTGAGTLELTAVNSYTGTTTVQEGTLRVGVAGAIPSGEAVVVVDGALEVAFATDVSTVTITGSGSIVGSGGLTAATYTLNIPAGNAGVGGMLSGTGSLSKSGAGTATLSTANSYTGRTTIGAGVLEATTLANAGSVSSLGAATGTSARIDLGSGTGTATLRYVGTGHSTNRVISLAGSSGGGGILDASGSGTVAFTGGVTGVAGTTLTLTGSNTAGNFIQFINSPSVSVVKNGPGTWVLGSNAFSGSLTVEQGTIIAAATVSGSFSPFGQGPDPVVGLANATGTAALLAASGFTISQTVQVAAAGTGSQEVILGGAGAGTSFFDSTATLKLGRDVTLAADPGGTVLFSLPANRWQTLAGGSATTAINVGTLTATGTVTFNSTLPSTIPTVNVRQGTLRLGNGATAGALGPDTTLTGSAGATLAFNRSDTITSGVHFASTISGGLNVRQIGSGTVRLSGVNTYTGATDVDAGTLRVDGVLGNTALTVAMGATLTGTGLIGGPTTILGTHSPGASPGIETFTNGVTYGASSTLVWELIGNTDAQRGILFDGVDLTGGALSIVSGATLSLVFNLPGSTVNWDDSFWDSARSWTIIDVAGGSWNSSLFTTLLVGVDSGTASLEAKRPDSSFQIVAADGDLVLQYIVVPEPGAVALTAIGLAVAWAARRRAQRAGG